MIAWEEQWQNYNGWAKVFVQNIHTWINRKWGNVNFYMTQAITGYGVFGTYLYSMKIRPTSKCWYCEEEDSPEHTIFLCVR